MLANSWPWFTGLPHLNEATLVDQLPDGLEVGGTPGDVGLWEGVQEVQGVQAGGGKPPSQKEPGGTRLVFQSGRLGVVGLEATNHRGQDPRFETACL